MRFVKLAFAALIVSCMSVSCGNNNKNTSGSDSTSTSTSTTADSGMSSRPDTTNMNNGGNPPGGSDNGNQNATSRPDSVK